VIFKPNSNASGISFEGILQKDALLKLKDLGQNVLSKSVKNIVLELITEALRPINHKAEIN
jgi:hypothetical protein